MTEEILKKPRRLEIEFLTNKSKYVLLRRSERSAVYKQYMDGVLVGYEVYSPIHIRKAEVFKGIEYPLREVVPSNENWSQCAWSLGNYYTEEEAIKYFERKDKEVVDGVRGKNKRQNI